MPRDLDGDEITVGGARSVARRDCEFTAELLFLDRHQAAAAAGHSTKNSERPVPGAIDQLEDARRCLFVATPLDAQERPVANTGCGVASTTRNRNVDDWRSAMRGFVPFGRSGQKFAIVVTADNVGNHHRRQCTALTESLALPFDMTAVGKFPQHPLQRRAVRVFGAERARDLAGADLAGMLA